MQNVVMCQPHNNNIIWQSGPAFIDAAHDLARDYEVVMVRPCSSLLAYGFNMGFAEAINRKADWFVMLHADIEPTEGWARQLIADAEEYDLDVIHAPVCLKDRSGYTSTAVVHDYDRWTQRKRLTLHEIAQLPDVFTVDDVRNTIDSEAVILLPNTGCHAIRIADWCRGWHYTQEDQIRVKPGTDKLEARVLSEDWRIGFDAHELGLRVGGTNRVKTKHYGVTSFSTRQAWGEQRDRQFDEWKQSHLTTPADVG